MSEKLTADTLAKMKPNGRRKVFLCDNAASFEAARRNAYHIRQQRPRPDGYTYQVATCIKTLTITISLIPPTQ